MPQALYTCKSTEEGLDQEFSSLDAQRAAVSYLQSKSASNRDTFFYYQGRLPSAVRYKNWKFYYTMMGSTGVSALGAAETFHWTQLQNIEYPFPGGNSHHIAAQKCG
jgi:hypothetical protein